MNNLKDIRRGNSSVELELEHEVVRLDIEALSGGFFSRNGACYLSTPLSGVWAHLTELAGVYLFLDVAELEPCWQVSSLNSSVVCQFLDARAACDLGVKVMVSLASGLYQRYVQQADLLNLSESHVMVWTEGQLLGFAHFLICSEGVWYIENM